MKHIVSHGVGYEITDIYIVEDESSCQSRRHIAKQLTRSWNISHAGTFAPCFCRTSSASLWPRSAATWNGVIKLVEERISECEKQQPRDSTTYLTKWNTHSLFFSWMLAPFRRSSSVTCLRLGWGDATAQCCEQKRLEILINTSSKPSAFRDHALRSPERSRANEGVWSWWSLEPFSWPLPCLPHGPLAKACVLWTHLDEGKSQKIKWLHLILK